MYLCESERVANAHWQWFPACSVVFSTTAKSQLGLTARNKRQQNEIQYSKCILNTWLDYSKVWNAIHAFIHYLSVKENHFSLEKKPSFFLKKIIYFSLKNIRKMSDFSLKRNHFSTSYWWLPVWHCFVDYVNVASPNNGSSPPICSSYSGKNNCDRATDGTATTAWLSKEASGSWIVVSTYWKNPKKHPFFSGYCNSY